MGKVRVTKYKFDANNSFTALLITDVHYSKSQNVKDLNIIENTIKKIRPSYVFFCGDFLDNFSIFLDEIEQEKIIRFFKNISKISKVIYSYGNHEFYLKKHKWSTSDIIPNKLNQLDNVCFLDDAVYEDDNIYVFGLTLPKKFFNKTFKKERKEYLVKKLISMRNKTSNIKRDKIKILMNHSPSYFLDNDVQSEIKEFNIVLSGHYHGGLTIPILEHILPKNFGIVNPNKTLFVRYARGEIKRNNISLIISSGYTKLSHNTGYFLNVFNGMFYKDMDLLEFKKCK